MIHDNDTSNNSEKKIEQIILNMTSIIKRLKFHIFNTFDMMRYLIF